MVRTSSREIVHLVASLLVLTIAFTYPRMNPQTLAIVAFGVGTGFLLHELAHKVTAQRYQYSADYEASPMGLLLALGVSFITGGNFVFAAPGAVMIRSKKMFYRPLEESSWDSLTRAKELAYISVSGVVLNLILALSFLIISLFTPALSFEYTVLRVGAFINVFLAGFNMIPFGPLDGAKVWRYNPVLWGMVGIPSIILFFLIA